MPQVLFRQIRARLINWQAFYDEIAHTMDAEVKTDLLAYFERVTKSWRNAQTFKATRKITKEQMTVSVKPVGASAKIWEYVSQGTRPHIIRPKNKRALRFEWGGYGSYKPKTTTSGGYQGPGVVVGGKTVFRMEVKHPGNKARNFERHIARWYAPQFRRTMDAAVKRGLRKAQM
jgi:hypothetical protein